MGKIRVTNHYVGSIGLTPEAVHTIERGASILLDTEKDKDLIAGLDGSNPVLADHIATGRLVAEKEPEPEPEAKADAKPADAKK